VLKKRKVEAHGDFILSPVSPKEYKETVAELNGSRTNRVFEFFKVNVPERIGFAKHREAAERKAAALAAAEADAGETTTSPRAAPKRAGKRNAPAAATATAEGRAQKKCGGRPADSPPSPKRTRIVDVETGVVEDMIAAVPLRSAAPSLGSVKKPAGRCSCPSARRRRTVMMAVMSSLCLLLVTPLAVTALPPSAPTPLKTKASLAPLLLAHPAPRLSVPSNPLPLRPRSPKKMILLPPRRKTKKRNPTVAAIG
jgi:hypothetical protein